MAAQADSDPDSAQALAQLTAVPAMPPLNDLLQPSGLPDQPPTSTRCFTGPVLARIFFERAPATDEFIASVVAQWLAGRK